MQARREPVASNAIMGMLEVTAIMFLQFPTGLRLWLVCLMSVNMIGSLTFWYTTEGKMTFFVLMASAPLMGYLYQHLGFVRVLGLGHVLWVFLVPWILVERLPLAEDGSLFQKWLWSLVVIDSISLVLDVKDAHAYLILGQTEPTLEWKKSSTKTE
jgi:hypothetical protein